MISLELKKVFLLFLLVWAFVLPGSNAHATHIRAADLKVEPICDRARTFRITVIAYLNTKSNTRFGTSSQVYFGDGESVRIPITFAEVRADLGEDIAVATFTTTYTYASEGTYTVTYMERDRSTGIVNITNSQDVPYVTSVTHSFNSKTGCNNYPVLSVPPLDRACFGVAFLHSPGAYDVDGDSLSYQLSVPKGNLNTAADYTSPIATRFYTNYNQGNEAKNGAPVFFIGSVSGVLTWDAPGLLGEYNIAFNVIEWRKDSLTGVYQKLSTTTRDMQILVDECDNIRPELQVPADVCVIAGTKVEEIIFGTDEEKHPVKIEVFSEVLDFTSDKFPATYSPSPPVFVSSDPHAELRFSWNTDCMHVRAQPYQVVFKITDDPPKGPKLVNFKIWNIKVIAPPPLWKDAKLNLVNRSAILSWSNYSCNNANHIQVWRKVDSYPYTPGPCETGLPKSLGYDLVANVNATETTFTDTNQGRGLVVGARYCYRLMAYFNAPASTPSVVSMEVCLDPIQADAPVITHVSIVSTAKDEGRIAVSWRSPFDINATQFPKPYEYEVFRAKGIAGDTSIVKAGRVRDTTFLDTGVNTAELFHNYRIVLYAQPEGAPSFIPVDTSAVASSVRLVLSPGEKQFQLTWRDSVPWSNVSQKRPYHLIYRGIEDEDPRRMVLIDSINVADNGFEYIDLGKYNNQSIEDDVRYSYRILTRGTYGNPAIQLQENFSQVVTAYPKNELAPCDQRIIINQIKCEDYLAGNNCDQTEFSNTLHWGLNATRGCRKDIVAYNVYASAEPEGEYVLLASQVKDTLFVDTGLPSFKRCYKVSAIDKNGVESELSESVCNDNCPYYMLPNVFTPNADGYNDTFNANFDRLLDVDVNTDGPIRCPRFVTSVSLKIYNRWGKEVFHFKSADKESALIDWNGKDVNGNLLETGLYYYAATVTFDVLDPSQQTREIKGWVHLLK